MTFAAGLAAVLVLTAGAAAAGSRVPVDPNAPPWIAIAKVQTNTGTRCTGVLIAPSVVLTAAHCLYNRRTQALLRPLSLHVLFGFERDRYRQHLRVAEVTLGPGFVPGLQRPQPGDWARLDLAGTATAAPLPRYDGPVKAGLAVALAGYNRDRSQLLLADRDCRVDSVERLAGGARYLLHDCAATYGTSGAPLLAKEHGHWAWVAINLAAGRKENLALVPAPTR